MSLVEVVIALSGTQLDAWSDAMMDAGAVSVSIEDEDVDSPDEVAVYGEPGLPAPPAAWANNRVSVLLPEGTEAGSWLGDVAAAMELDFPDIIAIREIADQDWVRLTQAQFTPVIIGRLAVVPSWHEVPEGPDLHPIRIDPGAAFGTGTHPTTRLCLAWMSAHLTPGVSVLDYGCGSGILSIGAARLGASPVTGVDIDPQAVRTAAANASANGVSVDYLDADAFAASGSSCFDVVVANILAKPLMLLAPSLLARVAPAGTIVLSGILDRQAEDVMQAYRSLQATMQWSIWSVEDGWVALVGRAAG